MKVCIAEKPSVAREIADILGAKKRMDGYYEGNGYQVTWTFGHLCTLKEPHEYYGEWKRWDMRRLPMLPPKFGIKVIENEGVQRQFGIIEKLVTKATEVINCGDAGQEGEVIQRWVLSKASSTAPLKRLWISSLTEEAIKEGFENLKEGTDFDQLYAAGSARAIGDWLLGLNATRLYTLKYGQNRQVLSIGRVQTPTLAIVVKRHLEIENFKSEPYWELKTDYRNATFSATSGRFKSIEEAEQKLKDIQDHDFEITSFEKKDGKEQPPRLFDLTSLQVECNKKFGFSADDTLKLIQSLYEKKLTTYPRVDTTYLSEDIYPKVPGILQKLEPYQDLVQPLLQDKIRKSKKVFDDKKITDHHAIIPTGVFSTYLNGDEKRVYDVVTRRFISVFYPDCKVANTSVLGESNKVEFKVTGKQILDPGWRVVYAKDKSVEKDKNEEENLLPVFEKGERGPHEPGLSEKKTQAPKYYTEASLLRAMESAGKNVDDEELRDLMKENGIGRPSTRANIIETLFRRKYIRREKKKIVATQTGIELIAAIENDLLKSAELTGQWEKKLRQIEAGEYDVKVFMSEMKEMVKDVVLQVKQSPKREIHIFKEEEKKEKSTTKKTATKKDAVCPKCKKGTIIKGKTAWGCSSYKDGCDFRLPLEMMGKKLSDSQIKALVAKGKTGTIKGFVRGDQKLDGILILTSDLNIEFQEKEEEKLLCPKCKQGEIIKGKSAWGCSNFRNGCRMVIPFVFMDKKLTESQMKQLVLKGKTGKVKGFSGEKPEGKLSFGSDYNLLIE
jgi:DNA topoisomerase-3